MGNRKTIHRREQRRRKREWEEKQFEIRQKEEYGMFIALKDRFGDAVKLTKDTA